jgi:hypothetical protein
LLEKLANVDAEDFLTIISFDLKITNKISSKYCFFVQDSYVLASQKQVYSIFSPTQCKHKIGVNIYKTMTVHLGRMRGFILI